MKSIKLKTTKPLYDLIHIMEIINNCSMMNLGYPEGTITGVYDFEEGGIEWKKKK